MPVQPHVARPETTAKLTRGVCALFEQLGYAPLVEAPLASGRRADVMALSTGGEIVIAEVKSCAEDFLSDGKWMEYAAWCDAFYFAVDEDFPRALLPADAGLIVADGFGGAIVRPAAVQPPLAGARRKAMVLSFARTAALRALRRGA